MIYIHTVLIFTVVLIGVFPAAAYSSDYIRAKEITVCDGADMAISQPTFTEESCRAHSIPRVVEGVARMRRAQIQI